MRFSFRAPYFLALLHFLLGVLRKPFGWFDERWSNLLFQALGNFFLNLLHFIFKELLPPLGEKIGAPFRRYTHKNAPAKAEARGNRGEISTRFQQIKQRTRGIHQAVALTSWFCPCRSGSVSVCFVVLGLIVVPSTKLILILYVDFNILPLTFLFQLSNLRQTNEPTLCKRDYLY